MRKRGYKKPILYQ